MTPLILASASPRRYELLRGLGLEFEVAASHCEEPPPGEADLAAPGQYVERLALLKARACPAEGLIIAADTIVEQGGVILGKPTYAADALRMLLQLQGQTHRVYTGVCLRHEGREVCEHQVTNVTFGSFDSEFLQRYIATGEPMDKAGAYAAQGKGALLVQRLEGDYWNVVGLPLNLLARMLKQFGVPVESFWGRP